MDTREFLRNNKWNIAVMIGLVAFAVIARLVPHPANFTPVAAMAIFAGAVLPNRSWALYLPLMVMVVSDLIIGTHSLILFTWGSFVIIGLLSHLLLRSYSVGRVVGMSVLASVLFFVVTNFGVWLEGRLYAQTFEGLIQCYVNALPFFRNTLLGDLVYTGMLFGVYELGYRGWRMIHSPQLKTN